MVVATRATFCKTSYKFKIGLLKLDTKRRRESKSLSSQMSDGQCGRVSRDGQKGPWVSVF